MQIDHLQKVVMANKVVEVMVEVEVEEDTTNSIIEMEMITKIILEEGAMLLDLKSIYSILDVKNMNTVS